ncbi:MAG: hypothetical protein GTO45_14955 [Candidatus Aminicenantes bacterium]|nr:hypothetical protein [Candidatus Aminicenantes bacterium]NIM80063.1 hypothetical protein [Candidatus Aminicenantes bacterium]NIN19406.1 hypothetical protein [Candidatus Aminicenantes bacterium]NIN43305.1 hypothetical protein [Candidatus Aminicenantes bacterium]NIN86049.1 hypothetical protein [Candidatus Aminicenantes bacterium]
MTVLLKQAFEKISELPETLQDEIAKELLADIEAEARWEKISEHVKKLVEEGRIMEARNILSTIPSGVSTALNNWQKALYEPKVKFEKFATGGESREDVLWLQNNSEMYKGKWIALKNGILYGSHESRIELRRSLKQAGKLAGTMFFRIEN